jgi:hypothetical protein
MLIRGTFSQKKLAWEAMEGLEPALASMVLYDDVKEAEGELSYRTMCIALKKNGRAVIARPGGNKEFLLTEGERNAIREWDVDEDGRPVPNPVG